MTRDEFLNLMAKRTGRPLAQIDRVYGNSPALVAAQSTGSEPMLPAAPGAARSTAFSIMATSAACGRYARENWPLLRRRR
jgi:hypothetical protein